MAVTDKVSYTRHLILKELWAHQLGVALQNVKDESDFFELGGDSVTAMRLVFAARQQNIDLRATDIYNHSKLEDMASQIVNLDIVRKNVQRDTQETQMLNVSDMKWTWGLINSFCKQTGMDVDQVEDLYETTPTQVVTMPMVFQLVFKLIRGDKQRLKEGIERIQKKVPLMRARCIKVEGSSYHFITRPGLPLNEEIGQYTEYLVFDQRRSMQYGEPLCRFALIQDEEETYLCWSLSHGICDRPSRAMYIQELKEALQDPDSYTKKPLRHLPRDFAAYIKTTRKASMDYWEQTLNGASPEQPLQTKEEPANRHTTQFYKRMKHTASPVPSVLFATITQAAYCLCLAQKGKLDDITITTARTGRVVPLPDIERLIGCCAAAAPTRAKLKPQQSLSKFLQDLQHSVVESLPHEAWGIAALAKVLGRFPSHVFSHSTPEWATLGDGITVETHNCSTGETMILQLTIPQRRNPWATYVDVTPGVDGGTSVKVLIDEVCFPRDEFEELINDFIDMVDKIVTVFHERSWNRVKIGDILPHLYNMSPQQGSRDLPATLANLIPRSPPNAAIILPESDITVFRAEFEGHIARLQQCLANYGIFKGCSVAMSLPNGYELLVAFLATSCQRGIVAPLNPKYKATEYDFFLSDLNPMIILVPKGSHDTNGEVVRAARRHDVAIAECHFDGGEVVLSFKHDKSPSQPTEKLVALEEDVALVLHTSGTTGLPKAVPLTHKNLITSTDNLINTYLLTPEDRTVLVMPLFHIHGLVASFLAPLRSGGTIILPSQLKPDFWQTFDRYGATWYTSTPTIHSVILSFERPSPMPKVRFIRSCSSPLSPLFLDTLEKALGAPVIESYAMTEASHIITSNPLPPAVRKPGTVGKVQGGLELRILDAAGVEMPQGREGEFCIRGASVTKGYLNCPISNDGAFTSDGFFRTGDFGRLDQEGYLTLTGRLKEFINKGGEKISPVELDNVISQCGSVQEVVCFAIEDAIYGQDVGCAVVQAEGAVVSITDLKRWIRQRIASHKVPKQVSFC
ncbi:hypothetical protein BDV96DRAFT_116812 [Lophiotrema nucula]|uniref:Carrier domain-containing protein n=1 Tax=Lophiotrema nucula TaxID=690887 RepID=A0A6A5Z2W8_9PLEO|nr:hypothetical protein BDV96DRAFT_116812 [Lophiotrema nucula]